MSIQFQQSLRKAYYKLFSHDSTRFFFVGGIGFIVNFAILSLLFDVLNFAILPSQIIGAETALLTTFVGNNFWAFVGHHHISVRHKLAKYHASAGIAILINSTCVVLLVKYANAYYGLALVVGSLAGLAWNYTLNKKVIFKTHKSKDNVKV